MLDHGITQKQKQSLIFFSDDSVSIEKERGGGQGKEGGQKHHTLVAANELKPVSSHIECLVTQQEPFSLTKRGKNSITKSLLNKHDILACEQIAFNMQKKISYQTKVARIFNQTMTTGQSLQWLCTHFHTKKNPGSI